MRRKGAAGSAEIFGYRRLTLRRNPIPPGDDEHGVSIGGVISASLPSWLADHWGCTDALLVVAVIAFCGGLRWMKVDPKDEIRA